MFKVYEAGNFLPKITENVHYISWTPFSRISNHYQLSHYASHYVSWPYEVIKRTMYMSDENIVDYFRTVDRESETGTFCPFANITIMPNSRTYIDREIYAHFGDAVKAQDMTRARKVIFDMRDYLYFFPNSSHIPLSTSLTDLMMMVRLTPDGTKYEFASNNEYAYMISYRLGYRRDIDFIVLTYNADLILHGPRRLEFCPGDNKDIEGLGSKLSV